MIACRLLQPAEFSRQEDARRKAVGAWMQKNGNTWTDELRALNKSFFPPGTMWFCPWYHDPSNPKHQERARKMLARPASDWEPTRDRGIFLSRHYYETWADKRPPIEVVGPNHHSWCPDQVSSNGTGWTVTGIPPLISCTPSIWLAQGSPDAYHGYLGSNGAPPGFFGPPV